MALVICRCEQITDDEIKAAISESGARTHRDLRLMTRAGMGACQGRCCEGLVRKMLVQELKVDPATIKPPRSRVPLRPVPTTAVGDPNETLPYPGVVLPSGKGQSVIV